MSRYKLTNNSPEAMREIVETFQATTVAPKLLQEEGWNVFDEKLTDAQVAWVIQKSGIRPGKWFSHKHVTRLCRALDATLSTHYILPRLVAAGYAERSVNEDGHEIIRITKAGLEHVDALSKTGSD